MSSYGLPVFPGAITLVPCEIVLGILLFLSCIVYARTIDMSMSLRVGARQEVPVGSGDTRIVIGADTRVTIGADTRVVP